MVTDISELMQDQDDDDNGMLQVRKALRESEKVRKALEAEVSTARKTVRQNDLASLLTKAGLKKAVATYVPDTVTDEDSLEVWLKSDEGSVFADARATPVATEADPAPASGAAQVFQRLAQAEAGASASQPVVGQEKAAQGLAEIGTKDFRSGDDFLAALRTL